MTLHWELQRKGLCALGAALAALIVAGVTSPARSDEVSAQDALAQDTLAQDTQDTLAPGIDVAARAPATFFRINDVLAKLDAMRGRGPKAVRLAALTPSNIATDAAPEPRPAPAKGDEPFGLFTFRAPEGLLWQKWRGLEAKLTRDAETMRRCEADAANCPSNAAQFLRLVGAVKSKSGRARLDEANRAVNMVVRYVSDYAQHGEADRWSSPLETFATAKGDCEDYAIAKYVALHEAGFPREDLRLVLVRDRAVRQDHAVLAARIEGQWLVLDNRRSELIEESGATNLAPLFAIDHAGVHLFAAPYAQRQLAGPAEAAPAASGEGTAWGNVDIAAGAAWPGALPLLM
ncbi:transglutaminase-like cysteine peptidase [Bradyrhizobium cajani]|uniref:Transglutaminase n=1 Tax=Bradyrhizobium cajani TaxID=1928661 RepID=A0A844T9Y9_9BRAD|nr:transglutaminase-like cysteine peptidase [Bradyrhizobium cajani]MCP3368072.1 transglutaminase-like cysteine peptidase [Bradyrhizobium cajani]MVT71901.1 transglutaminase [Bradyrhizobium cajani]